MPACGQAVGCGVCDTPELWRGAVGLCARVRACAGAAESLHTYVPASGRPSSDRHAAVQVALDERLKRTWALFFVLFRLLDPLFLNSTHF